MSAKRDEILDNAEAELNKRITAGNLNLADLTVAFLARPVSRTTANGYFKDPYDVCAALVRRHRLAGSADNEIPELIKQGAAVHYRRVSREPEALLEAGLRKPTKSLSEATDLFNQTEKSPNVLHRIKAATYLAEARIEASHREGTPEARSSMLQSAWQTAEYGLNLVAEEERDHIEAALECATIAAHAARLLSRDDEVELRYLSYVSEYKTREAEFADRLHLSSRAAVARFHSERADALIKDDEHRSLRAFKSVTDALMKAKADGETIEARYLNMLISRLCAHELAHPNDFDTESDQVRRNLVHLYGKNVAARRTAELLIDVVKSAPSYEIDVSSVDMVRLGTFGAVGHLCTARLLRRLYERALTAAEEDSNTSDAHATDEEDDLRLTGSLAVQPREYLVAALDYLQRSRDGMRKSGPSGVLRAAAEHERLDLMRDGADQMSQSELELPEMSMETITKLVNVIDQLVMIGLVRRGSGLRQLNKLMLTLSPVYEYVKSGSSDVATIFHENTDG